MKDDYIAKLASMTAMIAELAESMTDAAEIARSTGAHGVAFSCLMLRESLLSYCAAVTEYAATGIDE